MRGLPGFAGELPVSALLEEMTTPGEGQVRGLLTIAGNPVSSTPGGHLLDRAIAGLDAVVAIDFYVNETTRHADVILPPAGPLERDHYDLIFHTLAVRDTARWSPALFPPGPARSRTGRSPGTSARRSSAPGVAASGPAGRVPDLRAEARLRVSPRRQVDALLRSSGARLSVAKARGDARRCRPRPAETPSAGTAPHPRERIGLLPAIVADALPDVLEAVSSGRASPTGRLLLIGRRHQRDNNSWLHNALAPDPRPGPARAARAPRRPRRARHPPRRDGARAVGGG